MLDYSIESPQERVKVVEKIVAETPPSQMTSYYKEILANYILFALNKAEKKEKKILTDNRKITVNKREISYEALIEKLENGEDGVYNLIHEDKNTILSPKKNITKEDIEEIPYLKTLVEEIEKLEVSAKAAIGSGRKAFLLRQQLIQMRQDQYVMKTGAKQPSGAKSFIQTLAKTDIPEQIFIDPDHIVHSTAYLNLYNPNHVQALLVHYSEIKQEIWEDLDHDMHFLMMDLDQLIIDTLLTREPLLFTLLILKVDKMSNKEIQKEIEAKYGIKYSYEYLSLLWRHKIPKLIVEESKKQWLLFHYTYEVRGKWKKCNRCQEIKLAHSVFFSKNKTSKDGFYSICKSCRNKKGGRK